MDRRQLLLALRRSGISSSKKELFPDIFSSLGAGKRTIALAFAKELGVTAKVTFARSMERKGDLTAILTDLGMNEFLLVEDVCRLRSPLKDILGVQAKEFAGEVGFELIDGQRLGSLIAEHGDPLFKIKNGPNSENLF